ncbi:MAG: hypothetical protein A7316_10650 [Candidatus Altiarchaeales archaeon WOR_SM1_86-2]|nr:MAG: hypothetical protein A7316_10650 [Candidatus Altiarchaeales archaeon WOR_SM1_86-2]
MDKKIKKRKEYFGIKLGAVCLLIFSAVVLASTAVNAGCLGLTKTADPDTILTGESEVVTYTYTIINNCGSTMYNIGLTDDPAPDSGITCSWPDPSEPWRLSAGETANCTATATLTGGYAGQTINNTANATGYVEGLRWVNATANATVTVTGEPSINIVKTADPTMIENGGLVTYTYNVTNTGDVTLKNIVLVDDKLTPKGIQIVCPPQTTLAPNESMICIATTTLIFDPLDYLPVPGGGGTTVPASSQQKVDGLIGEGEYANGSELRYFTQDIGPEEWVGKLYTNYNNTTDTWYFAFAYNPDVVNDNSYAPSGTKLKTWQWKKNEYREEGQEHKFDELLGSDHLKARIYDRAGNEVLDFRIDLIAKDTSTGEYGSCGHDKDLSPYKDKCEADVMFGDSAMILDSATSLEWNMQNSSYPNAATKSPDINDTLYTENGTYQVTENNASGDPYLWEFMMIYEWKIDGSVLGGNGLGYVDIHDVHNSPYKIYSGQVVIGVTNVANVTGEGGGKTVSDSDNATVLVTVAYPDGTLVVVEPELEPLPSIDVVKTANPTMIQNGEEVTYTYVVTNTGAAVLGDIVLEDDKLGAIDCPYTILVPGGSMTCTKTTTINVNTSEHFPTTASTSAQEVDGLIGAGEYDGSVPLFFTQDAGPDKHVGTLYSTYDNAADIWYFAFAYNPDVVNDNSYAPKGTRLKTWQWKNGGFNKDGNEHKFDDLLGSDHLKCMIENGAGNKVLDFSIDLIAKDTSTGEYGSGGHDCSVYNDKCEGDLMFGDGSMILDSATSLEWNMQKSGFNEADKRSPYIDEAEYLATGEYVVTESYEWEFTMIYEFAINGSVLGEEGLGKIDIHDVHNSPYKTYSGGAIPGVINVATVTGEGGGKIVTDKDDAVVGIEAIPPVGIPEPPKMTINKEVIEVKYRITYTNIGTSDADVVITDTIPAGSTYIIDTCGGTESGGVVTMDIGTVAADGGGSCDITIGVEGLSGLLTNSAALDYSMGGVSFPAVGDTAGITL